MHYCNLVKRLHVEDIKKGMRGYQAFQPSVARLWRFVRKRGKYSHLIRFISFMIGVANVRRRKLKTVVNVRRPYCSKGKYYYCACHSNEAYQRTTIKLVSQLLDRFQTLLLWCSSPGIANAESFLEINAVERLWTKSLLAELFHLLHLNSFLYSTFSRLHWSSQ